MAAASDGVAGRRASSKALGEAVDTFPGVEHRIEFVRSLNGVEYYNDSKATNVDATLKAIDAFPGHISGLFSAEKIRAATTILCGEPLRQRAKAALLIGAAAQLKLKMILTGSVPLIRSRHPRPQR